MSDSRTSSVYLCLFRDVQSLRNDEWYNVRRKTAEGQKGNRKRKALEEVLKSDSEEDQ